MGDWDPALYTRFEAQRTRPAVELLARRTLGKPHPDPFLKDAHDLGVDPEKCLVFEDGDPGTKAAEAAGMKWIRVDKV